MKQVSGGMMQGRGYGAIRVLICLGLLLFVLQMGAVAGAQKPQNQASGSRAGVQDYQYNSGCSGSVRHRVCAYRR